MSGKITKQTTSTSTRRLPPLLAVPGSSSPRASSPNTTITTNNAQCSSNRSGLDSRMHHRPHPVSPRPKSPKTYASSTISSRFHSSSNSGRSPTPPKGRGSNASFNESQLYMTMARQEKLHSFLLNVVKSIFQDMVSMDSLIVKIMNFAQKLVNADRSSLFLVDARRKELYARIFDVSGDGKGSRRERESFSATTKGFDLSDTDEIRFPVGVGIAGYVAQTGKGLNIPDCYNDTRFNRDIDQQTGYTTKNLLCMPIFIRGNIIGVVQMVNKLDGVFTQADEDAFAIFATYCGLALHHARLYEKIHRSEQKYKVALEILSYHNTTTEEELELLKDKQVELQPRVGEYEFSPYGLTSDDKVLQTIAMFYDLFTPPAFSLESLYRFVLTVRKNYRRVPYHNWTHGFSVANAVYVVIKQSRGFFHSLEELSLLVSCLCHDLDHRGKTNQFLINSKAPLAAMYSTSVLEHHHFNQTVAILQQDGHNILKNLTPAEYKQVLGNIKHCILATDLALFFPNMAKLKTSVTECSFEKENPEHRLLLQAITMTACDLVASTKPWDQQIETVRVIFEEFYDQGDEERRQGKAPIAMMDRHKKNEQPASQVGFLRGICIPCYQLLSDVIPATKPLLDNCKTNLKKWESIVEEQQEESKTTEVEASASDQEHRKDGSKQTEH